MPKAYRIPPMQYLIRRGLVEIGKFALADIKALMNAGVILPTDLFSIEGMTETKPVSSLFAQETSLPTPTGVPPLPTVRTENGGQVVLTMAVGPSCPSCYSTDVIKARASHELHVKQHSLSAGTLSGLSFWASGKTTNQVGANCAPPIAPEKTESASGWQMITLFTSLFAAILILFSCIGPREHVLGYASGAVFTGVICFFCFKQMKARMEEIETNHVNAIKEHQRKMADYDRTWRCNKCGVMYQQ